MLAGPVEDELVEARLLTIGSFARRSRLSVRALRLYDRLGLLSPAVIDPDTGYRRYREDQLFTARLIVGLRRLDMPLSDVAAVITAPGTAGADLVEEYWAAVERRFAFQRELAGRLGESLRGGEARSAAFTVRQRQAPEMVVLGETQEVDLSALPATISGTIARLTRRAAEHGGAAGGPVVVFHGEVNEDSNGPVEVWLPVRAASVTTLTVPSHPEAYVTVTRAQWEWPQILSAYDAVELWIRQNGQTSTGSPREIYRPGLDPRTASWTDEVCDVAFPISG